MSNNYPNDNSLPAPNHTTPRKPTGYNMTPPYPSHNSHNSHNSHTSVTPAQTAYHRCYQVALHTPTATLAPEPNQTAAGKPTGYHMTHPTHRYPLLTTVNHRFASVTPTQTAYRRCHQAARIPLRQLCRCFPLRQLFARAKPDCSRPPPQPSKILLK